MSQHTPGTWASSRHATPAAFPQFGIYSEVVPVPALACVMAHGTSDPTETEANARLIAAAPDCWPRWKDSPLSWPSTVSASSRARSRASAGTRL
jgi:hypothetical protein